MDIAKEMQICHIASRSVQPCSWYTIMNKPSLNDLCFGLYKCVCLLLSVYPVCMPTYEDPNAHIGHLHIQMQPYDNMRLIHGAIAMSYSHHHTTWIPWSHEAVQYHSYCILYSQRSKSWNTAQRCSRDRAWLWDLKHSSLHEPFTSYSVSNIIGRLSIILQFLLPIQHHSPGHF